MIDSKHIGPNYNFFVFKDELSDDLVNGLLKTTEKLIDSNFAKKHDMNDKLKARIYEGQQFLIPEVMLDQKLVTLLKENILKYVDALSSGKAKAHNPVLTSLWSVIQKAGDYNTVHYHQGTVSGIIYLKVPKEVSDETIPDGKISFINGINQKSNLIFNGVRRVVPKVGDMYLLPSWLHHTVYPFKSDKDRISVAFNFNVEISEND